MKATVLKVYRDKITKKVHKVGQELEITKERYEEINSTAFGVFLEEIVEVNENPDDIAVEENKEEATEEPTEEPKETKQKKKPTKGK